MTLNTWEDAWDYLVEAGIATEAELTLVTDINGASMESMRDVLYARTAYHAFDQLDDEDHPDEDAEDDEVAEA